MCRTPSWLPTAPCRVVWRWWRTLLGGMDIWAKVWKEWEMGSEKTTDYSCYRYYRSQKQRSCGLNPGFASSVLCDLEKVNECLKAIFSLISKNGIIQPTSEISERIDKRMYASLLNVLVPGRDAIECQFPFFLLLYAWISRIAIW